MKTILLVDDSASMRQVASLALTRGGYSVVEAADGREALAKLATHKCHLIISDVNMPQMDGLTFARAVKECAEHKFVPIIMLTTEASAEKKSQGRSVGVRAWMVKPFQPQSLLDAVAKLVLQ